MTAGHIADHRVLLPRSGGSAGQSTPALDAVVVPAARASRSIVAAIEVARLHEATLVVLSSRASAAAEVHRIARRRLPAERIVAVDLPDRRPDGMPALATDRIDTGGSGTRDTGLKRNLGLRLAVLLGWGQILFMDDDVSAPPDSVLRASRRRLAERGGPGAIGWAFDDFPDNSVACHAHRLAGGRQGTFVGAGGLLLRVDERLPHFPTVYNEDWLFFADLLVRRERGLALGGRCGNARSIPSPIPTMPGCRSSGISWARACSPCSTGANHSVRRPVRGTGPTTSMCGGASCTRWSRS